MPSYTVLATKDNCNGCLYQGCYDDNGENMAGRTLESQQSISGSNMTQEACTAACLATGHTYAGVDVRGPVLLRLHDPPAAPGDLWKHEHEWGDFVDL